MSVNVAVCEDERKAPCFQLPPLLHRQYGAVCRYNAKLLTMTDGQEIFIPGEKSRTFGSAFTQYAMK